jgi:hypothetical protein
MERDRRRDVHSEESVVSLSTQESAPLSVTESHASPSTNSADSHWWRERHAHEAGEAFVNQPDAFDAERDDSLLRHSRVARQRRRMADHLAADRYHRRRVLARCLFRWFFQWQASLHVLQQRRVVAPVPAPTASTVPVASHSGRTTRRDERGTSSPPPTQDDADRTAHHPHVEPSTHRGSAHRRRVNNTPALTSIHGGAGRVSFLTNDGTVLRMFDEPSWRSGGLNESDDDGAAQADGSRTANHHDTVGRGSARPMDMSSTDFSLWAAAPTAKERPPLQPVGRGGVTRRDVDSRSYVGTTKRAEQQWARELTTLYRELRSFRHQHSTGRYCETLLSMAGACTQLASAVASGSVAS